jgi:hypothetical protein
MSYCLSAVFNASGQQSWTPDADVQLTGYSSYGQTGFTISLDQSISASSLFASQQITDKMIGAARAGGAGFFGYTPLDFQVRKGETVYFSADAGGALFLFYMVSADIDHVV